MKWTSGGRVPAAHYRILENSSTSTSSSSHNSAAANQHHSWITNQVAIITCWNPSSFSSPIFHFWKLFWFFFFLFLSLSLSLSLSLLIFFFFLKCIYIICMCVFCFLLLLSCTVSTGNVPAVGHRCFSSSSSASFFVLSISRKKPKWNGAEWELEECLFLLQKKNLDQTPITAFISFSFFPFLFNIFDKYAFILYQPKGCPVLFFHPL